MSFGKQTLQKAPFVREDAIFSKLGCTPLQFIWGNYYNEMQKKKTYQTLIENNSPEFNLPNINQHCCNPLFIFSRITGQNLTQLGIISSLKKGIHI